MSNKLKMRKGKKGKKRGRSSAGFAGRKTGGSESLFQSALRHHQAGQLNEAEKLYRQVIKGNPGFADAWNNLGAALMTRGDLHEAERVYRKAIEKHPNLPTIHYNLGLVLRDQGKTDLAVKSFEKSIFLSPCHVDALFCLGEIASKRGDFRSAVPLYRKAVECDSSSVDALFYLGLALKKAGDLLGAEKYYLKAQEVSPGYTDLNNNLAVVYALLGDFEQAEIYYRKELEQKPDCVRTQSNLAEMLEKANRLDDAGQLVDSILNRDEHYLPAKRLKATLLRRQGEFEQGLAILDDMSIPENNTELTIEINSELGKLHDRAGSPAKAFHCFSEVNRLQESGLAGSGIHPENFINLIERISAVFSADNSVSAACEKQKKENEAAPVFLVGFPRSGTTLLDQIIDSHPDLRVAEETPVLDEIINGLSLGSEKYPEVLNACSTSAIKSMSNEYVARMKEMFPGNEGVIVDKYPLHLIHLGLIHLMFPKAKIIFAIRHPYDVCLSCFMQLFTLNDSMANFFTMESTAACYSKVMDLWLQYEGSLQLDVYRIRYEDLVSDMEGEVRDLLDFLGVGWDKSVMSFNDHAKKRGPIFTPSYQQVTEKVYTRAAGRWQRYEEFISPVKEQLESYVKYFGY